jgi:diacylglycerol O-acyltransferase / wax synthase
VNDILLAATTGAVRKYSEMRGDDFSGSKQYHNRALVPLAFFRPIKDLEDPARAMSNKFAFLSVDLPMNSPSAVDRVMECNKNMSELKTSPIAFVTLWIQSNLLSYLPVALQRQIGFDLFSRHTMVFSNVPGPNKPITLAGEKVVNMQVVFPNLLPQVILVSYAGSVFNCMVIDDKLIENPQKLCEYYLEDLREVAKKYNVDYSSEAMLSDRTPGNEFDMISAD